MRTAHSGPQLAHSGPQLMRTVHSGPQLMRTAYSGPQLMRIAHSGPQLAHSGPHFSWEHFTPSVMEECDPKLPIIA